MNFSDHYYSNIVSSPRQGILHLYNSHTNNIVSVIDFLNIMKFIKTNGGKVSSSNINVSEKYDGFSLKFGVDGDNEFFLESSHSGPIYNPQDFTKGEYAYIFKSIFKKLKAFTELQNYLKSINTSNGIKVYTEAFYLPEAEVKDDKVKFVTIWYDKNSFGNILTLVILNVTDGMEGEISSTKVELIRNGLKNLSNQDITFEENTIEDLSEIDLTSEINELEDIVNEIQDDYNEEINTLIQTTSRDKESINKRRRIRQKILRIQKVVSDKLIRMVSKGKFGNNFEGLVFNINGIEFKVTTNVYKDGKNEKENKTSTND